LKDDRSEYPAKGRKQVEETRITRGLDRRALLRIGVLTGAGVVVAGAVAAPRNARAASLQPGWDHCTLCQGMYYGNGQNTAGVCPGNNGGKHNPGTSHNYTLEFNGGSSNGNPQSGWDHCINCQGLYYGNGRNFAGVCPANGGTHNRGTSFNYALAHGGGSPSGNPQSGWNHCIQCQGLYYGNDNIAGVCPKPDPSLRLFGPVHSPGTSFDYNIQWTT
jgi:hypothetical protein